MKQEREITLELVRVTEAAALRASRWMGKGEQKQADAAAVDAMRGMLDYININGTVVIGEGEKDKAPMLYIGEKVGRGGPDAVEIDIAVDPLEGTRLTAMGLPNALSVIVAGEKGSIAQIPTFYMEKIACGERLKGFLDIEAPIKENIKVAAAKLNCDIGDIVVIVLDRPRNQELITEIRKIGARIRLLSDGDVAGAICTALEGYDADIYAGIGGSPEGVLAAAALKCMGGDFQGRLWFKDEEEKMKVKEAGYSLNQVFTIDDLVKGDSIIFSATGVTGGYLLPGVRYYGGNKAETSSMVMRARTGTIRYIKTIHRLDKKTIPSRRYNKEISVRETIEE